MSWQDKALNWQVPPKGGKLRGKTPLQDLPLLVHTDDGIWLQPAQDADLCLQQVASCRMSYGVLVVLVQRDTTVQGLTQAASHCFSWHVLQAIAGIQPPPGDRGTPAQTATVLL